MKMLGIFAVLATLIGLAVPAKGGLEPACCACRPSTENPVSQCAIAENQDEFSQECESENSKAFCIADFPGSLEECVEMLSENPLIVCANDSDAVAAPAVSVPIAVAMAMALASLGFAVVRRRDTA